MSLLSTLLFLGPIGVGELVVMLVPFLFFVVLPLIALVNILKSEFAQNNKLIWVLVVIFLPVLGSILYFFIGRKQKI